MLARVTRVFDYIGYIFGSTDLHGIHSPFVYNLATQVLYHKMEKRIESVEFQRTQMLKSKGTIFKKSLAEFTDTFTLPAKHAFALSRLVSYLNIQNITEYGKTNGIETNYVLNTPLLESKIPVHYRYIFSEENQVKVKTNEQWLKNYGDETKGIDWSQHLPIQNDWDLHILYLSDRADEIYDVWDSIKSKLHNHSIVVFTNIRYSDDHYLKWKQLTHDTMVSVDIDLFRLGFLFFRKEQPKESFLLRY